MSQRVLSSYQFKPPTGYYKQPKREAPLSGATPKHERLNQLGEALNGYATLEKKGGAHVLEVHHSGDGTSSIKWHGRTASDGYQPGEIHMVRSRFPGAAGQMHDTARAIASDDTRVAFPKHSRVRTDRGAEWVHNEQLRHGEQLWGKPDEGTPAGKAHRDSWYYAA